MKNSTKAFWFTIIPGSITGILIVLFLSEKIIDYPGVTAEEAIIAGAGVLIIMISVMVKYYLIYQLNKKDKQRKS